MNKFLIILTLTISLFACQKASDCFSSSGKEITIEQVLTEFDSLYVNSVFNVELIQDTINKISITGNEAFVNSTTFNIENNILILDNKHKCKFAKPKKNTVSVTIHVNEISAIYLNSSSKIFSNNTLTNSNEIGLIAKSKYNEADLIVNARVFYFWNNHLNGGKINVKGNVEIVKLWNTSLASINATKLKAISALVRNNSKGDCWVNVTKSIDCEITSTGNVFCKGNPEKVNYNNSSSLGGELFFE